MLANYDNNLVLGGMNFSPMLEITLTEPKMLSITQFQEVLNNKYEWLSQAASTDPKC